jgi:hypothetical protein
MKSSRHAVEIAFSLTAMRCSPHRRGLGPIISRTTDDFSLCQCGDRVAGDKRPTGMILSKKKLAMAFDFGHTSRSCGDNQSS